MNTKKLFAAVAASSIALAGVVLVSSSAQALETYTSVATASSQTFANGTTATASFANNGAYVAGGFNGQSTLGYKITADDNSSVTITFSSSQSGWTGISDLRLYYGWLNEGDYSQVLTNLAPGGLDLTDSSILISSSNSCVPGVCPGAPTYTATGLIKAPDGSAGNSYIGNIQLHFATPITSITVLGPADRPAPAGSYGAGQNGMGFSIPVVTHTVTFNSNYGTPTTTTQTKGVPTNLDANAFSRTGFEFDGWNDQQDGLGTDYTDGQSYDFAADLTLFAQWTSLSAARTVTFNPNGGLGTMAAQSHEGTTNLSPNTLTREGFTFIGWNTQQNGLGTPYVDGGSFNFSADETLFAQWAENHTVTFDANGGSGDMPAQETGGIAPLATNALTREGHTFAGWNTEEDGSGTSYADGEDFDFSSDQTLFAQWTRDPLGSGISQLGSLVNTGIAALGPVGTAGAILAIGTPFFLLSSRFRKVRAVGAIVMHKSSHLTISSPATMFDRLRRRK